MAEETITSRDLIRAEIRHEWGLAEDDQSAEAEVLAERIDRRLFGPGIPTVGDMVVAVARWVPERHREAPEVHIAGTCYRDDHPWPSILVARRAPDRHFYPGMWEGCGGQLRDGETFTEGAARHFREEMGLDVEVLEDRHVLYAIPASVRTSIPGVRFLCRYQGGEARSPNHSEVVWLPWEEFLGLDPAQCVPGLQRDVERLVGRLVVPRADDIAALRRYASSAARDPLRRGGMLALAVRVAADLERAGELEAEVRRLCDELDPLIAAIVAPAAGPEGT